MARKLLSLWLGLLTAYGWGLAAWAIDDLPLGDVGGAISSFKKNHTGSLGDRDEFWGAILTEMEGKYGAALKPAGCIVQCPCTCFSVARKDSPQQELGRVMVGSSSYAGRSREDAGRLARATLDERLARMLGKVPGDSSIAYSLDSDDPECPTKHMSLYNVVVDRTRHMVTLQNDPKNNIDLNGDGKTVAVKIICPKDAADVNTIFIFATDQDGTESYAKLVKGVLAGSGSVLKP